MSQPQSLPVLQLLTLRSSRLVWGPIEGMNDNDLVDKGCVKGYIYSKEDLAIDWKDVENHSRLAEGNGYRVMKKMIHGAGHVQLFKGKDGEKGYWEFGETLWNRGMEVQ
jgi:hypothetical protein